MNDGKSETGHGQAPDDESINSGLLITCESEESVVRQSFRVPAPRGMVTFTFNGQQFETVDLSMSGIGVFVDNPQTFRVGEILEESRIVFPDQSFFVDIEVIHVSPQETGALVCGMKIIRTRDAGYVDWVSRVIKEIKTVVLTAPKQSSK